MGVLDFFKFQRSPTFNDVEESEIKELSDNIALKNAALNKVANYVGRGISKAKFKVKGPDASDFSDWLIRLNVKPNPNTLASTFLSEIGKQLIIEGEVLIVVIKGYLYLADSYVVEKSSLSGDSYRVTTVQGITVDKVFKQEQVILIKNENDNLQNFTENLWTDYGELLGRLINRQKTANQIRFTMGLPKDRLREKAQELADGGAQKKSSQQRFFERVVNRIKKDSVVAIPINEGTTYTEFSNRYSSKASFVDDIKQVKNQYVDDVCEIVGIPTALIHGETADNQKNHEQVIETVFEPMIRKVLDGLQDAMFSEEQYLNGNFVKAIGLHHRDLFSVATPGDKLIAAGIVMADEIREEIDLPPLPNGAGKKLYITKNYQLLGVEGGNHESSES